MLTVLFGNVFTAMKSNNNGNDCIQYTEYGECINVKLRLSDKKLLEQLRNNYNCLKVRNDRYDVESMHDILGYNKNNSNFENNADFMMIVEKQEETFKEIKQIVEYEKIEDYIAFIQVLGECIAHLYVYDIDLFVDGRIVFTMDIEDKIINKYDESTIDEKKEDKKVQYFLRLAKYFRNEFTADKSYFEKTRKFLELANRFADYQENTMKFSKLIKTLVK